MRMMFAASAANYEIERLEITYRAGSGSSGEVVFRERLKALNAQGRDEISKFHVPYVPAFDDVEYRSIRTFKKDGNVVEGDPKGAFDAAPQTVGQLGSYFIDTQLRTILAPNLDTGDSLEVEVVRHIHKWAKDGEFWFSHELPVAAPVSHETIVLDLPADRRVSLFESAAIHGTTETANGRRIERWEMHDLEPSKASADPREPLFAVSSIASWNEFGAWIRSLNDDAAQPAPEIAALAAKLTAGKTTEEERIDALYGYVATHVRYVGVWFGNGRMQPHSASSVLRNGYGDCKDQTVLLSALLRSAGLKTHAVLTTPGAGLRLADIPSPEQFTHEFLAVETKHGLAFLDASLGPVPPQVLSFGVRGRKALLVGDPTSAPIDMAIEPPVPARASTELTGKVSAAGVFDGAMRVELHGAAELLLRRLFLDGSDAEKERVLSEFMGEEFRGASVRQVENTDPVDFTKPFEVKYQVHKQDFFAAEKKAVRVRMGWAVWGLQALQVASAPTKAIPFEPGVITTKLDLAVDPAFMITDHMPVHRQTAFGKYDSEYSYENGHLLLQRALSLKAGMLQPADWDPMLQMLEAAQQESGNGFELARRTATVSGLSPYSRAMNDGDAAFQKRDYKEAARAFLEATKIDPKSRVAWNSLGRAYASMRSYTEAEAAYKRQIEINPSDQYAYNNLALVYRALKREDDAIDYLQKQIAVSPRDKYAHENLAVSYANKNEWEKARAEMAIAVEITPDDATKWIRLGHAQIRTKQVDDARHSFDRALALGHDAMDENNIAYYLSEANVDLDRAFKLAAGAVNAEARRICEPDDISSKDTCTTQLRRVAHMLDTAGWILYLQGKPAEAVPYVRSAYAITPQVDAALHLAVVSARSGHEEEALRYFAEARTRSNFEGAIVAEARRELAKAVGGESELESRSKTLAVQRSGERARVIVLVDASGKVLEAKGDAEDAVAAAKSQALAPLGWPEHAFRSLRTVELCREGSGWVMDQAYAGRSPESTVAR